MTPIQILKKHYGYDSFRSVQEEVIRSILTRRDTIAIMPTGAGKSICFQVPALIFDNVTIVVSPLISLMNDQVNALRQSGISAAYINSTLSSNETYQIFDDTRRGYYKLIYVSPERLLTDSFISFAQSVNIDMVTIDEAHCISQWGQDFRPSYMAIPEFIRRLNYRPVVSAFTATATSNVKNDIIRNLQLNNPTSLTTGFDRSNLYFAVAYPDSKDAALEKFISARRDESGIIYCNSRKNVTTLHSYLNSIGYKTAQYHAGLSNIERDQAQEDFLFDRCTIMVATNAFGMGIDKSNVSYVVHYNMPKDVESYYQEAGRAGRDGRESFCLLLYAKKDISTIKWLIENRSKEIDPDNIQEIESEKIAKQVEYKRLDEMIKYATTTKCLRYSILEYFGEKTVGACGKCSNCNASKVELSDITVDSQKIISCIKRMDQRFGAKLVIDVLRGSRSAKITETGLDKLSTYNISVTSAQTLGSIIEFLIEEEYVFRVTGQYPTLRLGRRYKELLADNVKILAPIRLKTTSKAKEEIVVVNKDKTQLTDEQLALYEKLKVLCKELASEEGVPSFYVFMDKTLIDMAQKSPTNSEQFLKVVGVGEAKLAKYGEAFVDLINENL